MASALLVVAVLGVTFGLTAVQARRSADASIRRALLATRAAVGNYLAARTRTLGRASILATDVQHYRRRLLDQRARAIRQTAGSDVIVFALDTLNQPVVVGSTVPNEEIGPVLRELVGAAALAAADTTAGLPLTAKWSGRHLIGLAGANRTPGGDVRGGFVALRSREVELAAFNALRRTMLLAMGFGVLLAIAWGFRLARHHTPANHG